MTTIKRSPLPKNKVNINYISASASPSLADIERTDKVYKMKKLDEEILNDIENGTIKINVKDVCFLCGKKIRTKISREERYMLQGNSCRDCNACSSFANSTVPEKRRRYINWSNNKTMVKTKKIEEVINIIGRKSLTEENVYIVEKDNIIEYIKHLESNGKKIIHALTNDSMLPSKNYTIDEVVKMVDKADRLAIVTGNALKNNLEHSLSVVSGTLLNMLDIGDVEKNLEIVEPTKEEVRAAIDKSLENNSRKALNLCDNEGCYGVRKFCSKYCSKCSTENAKKSKKK